MIRINLKEKESDVLRGARRLLDDLRAQKRLTYRRISTTGIPRGVRNGQPVFTRNEMKGMTDLLVFLRHMGQAVTLHVEVKDADGRLSPAQLAWRDELAAVGHTEHHVVRSVEALARVLQRFGISHWTHPVRCADQFEQKEEG